MNQLDKEELAKIIVDLICSNDDVRGAVAAAALRCPNIVRENLYEIELAKCEAVNEFFECEFEQGGFANEHQRKTLAGRLQELYSDQRSERITLWKDISGLRRALPESAQQYLAAFRKLAILNGERGDSA